MSYVVTFNCTKYIPKHSGGFELHSPSASLSPSSLQVVFVKLLFDNAYPLLQVYVQTLPNWFVFVHETLPFVGSVLEGSHVIAKKMFKLLQIR